MGSSLLSSCRLYLTSIFAALALLTTGLAGAGLAQQDNIVYGSNRDGQLVRINLTQQSASIIDTLTRGTQAMEQDPSTGFIYYIEWQESGDEFRYYDPATGNDVLVRQYVDPLPFNYVKRMGFAPNRLLYMTDSREVWYTIDKNTGDLDSLGVATGIPHEKPWANGDLAFSPDGTCYVVQDRHVFTVDVATLTGTMLFANLLVQPKSNDTLNVFTGLAYCDDFLYTSNHNEIANAVYIQRIDPNTGQMVAVFNIAPDPPNTYVNDLTSCVIFHPFAPSALTATPISVSQIDLAWTDNADNEDGFKIERRTGAAGAFTEVAQVGADVTTYSDIGLNPATMYQYRVLAFNATNFPAYSDTAEATTLTPVPAAPTNLAAAAISESQIDLSWTDSDAYEDGFKIERRVGTTGTFIEIAQVGPNTTSFSDIGLNPVTVYEYRVYAFNTTGNSPYSNVAQATTTGSIVTLLPIADAYTSQAQPTSNFGTASELRMRQIRNGSFVNYIKFNVSGLAGGIISATLRLYVTTGSNNAGTLYNGSNNYAGTSNPWQETGITWNNGDQNGTAIATTPGVIQSNTWLEFDVTSTVSGEGTYTFSLLNNPTALGILSSREGSNPPELVLEVESAGPVNTPPVANNDNATTNANTAVVVDVLANDSDADGTIDPATVVVASAPANGTTSVNTTTGAITYTPNSGFSGNDSFTYTVNDNLGATSNAATVAVTVNAAGPTVVTFNPIADAYTSEAQPTSNFGTASELRMRQIRNGSFVNYIKFNVSGLSGAIQSATLRLYVTTGSNNAGTLYNGSNNYAGTSNPWQETGITWNNGDQNGTAIATTPGVIQSNTWLEFDVTSTVSGEGTYTFSMLCNPTTLGILSSREGSNPPELVLEVESAGPVNTPPVANNDNATTSANTAVVVDVLANDSDADGTIDPATVVVASAPANGTTSVNTTTGAITYTPNSGFSGNDSFTYTVNDNLGATSNAATVAVTVNAANVAPVANNDNATTSANTAVVVDVLANDSDADGTLDPATVVVASAPANGTTSVNTTTGAITYTPNSGFSGNDSFTYTVNDNLGATSNAATVAVTVNAANVAPVANNDNATTNANTAVVVDVLANDSDADGTLDPATVVVASAPANGTTSVNTTTGAITYTPNSGFSGNDSFTYTVNDNLGATSNPATVAVTVNAAGPTVVTFNPIADAYTSEAQPTSNFGTASELRMRQIRNGSFVNYIKFNVAGLSGAIQSATLRLYVTTGSNNAGTLYNGSNNYAGTNNPWQETGITWNNGDRNSTAIATTPGVIQSNTWLEFDVTSTVSGEGTYTFSMLCNPTTLGILSSREGSNPPELVLEVESAGPVNTPPVANNDNATTNANTAVVVDVLANDSDADGTIDPATVVVASAPANGTTSVNTTTGAITYTPNSGFSGNDSFTYTVNDNLGATSNAATVAVTVSAANVAPVANNDNATTNANTAVVVDVLANDSDADGTLDPATVVVASAPANGTTSVNTTTGAITYTPNSGFSGNDSFTYTVNDNLGATSNAATVAVTVNAANVAPVANNDNATTNANTAVVVDVLANDSDADGTLDPATVVVASAPANGTTSVNTTTGAITYTPNSGFSGNDSFTYTVNDNLGATSNAATVAVAVNAANVTTTYNPIADTYTSQAQPDANFGGAGELRFRQSAGTSHISYLKFDLSGLSGNVVQAKLRLYVTTASNNTGTLYTASNFYVGTTNEWTESGLTWNNGDRAGTALGTIATIQANTWYEFDVTSRITAPGRYSFGFVNSPVALGAFSSKEGSFAPELVVETTTGITMAKTASDARSVAGSAPEPMIQLPAEMTLLPNYPNPFNIETTIQYMLPEAAHVRVAVFNENGQLVQTLVDKLESAGHKRVLWNGRNAAGNVVASGVYFVRMKVGQQQYVQKINLLK